jgi:accessory gene regulator protein AgrB
MRSKFLRLNTRDFIKGLIVVIICALITGTYQLIVSGGVINWITIKPVVIAAAGAGVSYLTKNLLTNSKGDFLNSEENGKQV